MSRLYFPKNIENQNTPKMCFLCFRENIASMFLGKYILDLKMTTLESMLSKILNFLNVDVFISCIYKDIIDQSFLALNSYTKIQKVTNFDQLYIYENKRYENNFFTSKNITSSTNRKFIFYVCVIFRSKVRHLKS